MSLGESVKGFQDFLYRIIGSMSLIIKSMTSTEGLYLMQTVITDDVCQKSSFIPWEMAYVEER